MALYLRVKGKSDEDALRVKADASSQEIEQAYEAQSGAIKSAMKDRSLDAEIRQRGRALAEHLRAARDRLVRGKPKPPTGEYDSPQRKKNRLAAERAFQQGLEFYRDGKVQPALDEFQAAAEADPEGDEYNLWASWLSYRTATKDRQRERARKELQNEPTMLPVPAR